MTKIAFIAGTQVIQTGFSIGCEGKPVFRTLPVAGKQELTVLALRGEFRIFVHAELLLPMDNGKVSLADFSVSPEQWGEFLVTLFDEWVKEDVGKYFIQLFDATLANWVGQQPGVCTMARTCGHAGVMEYNGDVYSCDHFVFPEYKLGNIRTHTLVEMMYGERQQQFGKNPQETLFRYPSARRDAARLYEDRVAPQSV
mgnify:CR=1 FL=1